MLRVREAARGSMRSCWLLRQRAGCGLAMSLVAGPASRPAHELDSS